MAKAALASFLRQARIAAGLSQKKVARELGYKTPQFISSWERGLSCPPRDVIKALCGLYKVDLDAFYQLLVAYKTEEIKSTLRKELYGEERAKTKIPDHADLKRKRVRRSERDPDPQTGNNSQRPEQ